MAQRLFLPIRRGTDVVVFESCEQPTVRRWEFHAAASGPLGGELKRTGMVRLTDAELARCAEITATLPRLEAVLSNFRLIEDQSYPGTLDMPAELASFDSSPLLTVCMYLQFARQMLVLEASFRKYDARDPQERFDLGLSASVVDGLLKRDELARAERILTEDAVAIPANVPRMREWGYYFGLAASVMQRLGKPAAAVDYAKLAARAAPGAAIWRRIGNLSADNDDRPGAIQAFMTSEGHEPLNGKQAMRLAWWLFHEGDRTRAGEWARTAADRGATNAERLLSQLAAAEGKSIG